VTGPTPRSQPETPQQPEQQPDPSLDGTLAGQRPAEIGDPPAGDRDVLGPPPVGAPASDASIAAPDPVEVGSVPQPGQTLSEGEG